MMSKIYLIALIVLVTKLNLFSQTDSTYDDFEVFRIYDVSTSYSKVGGKAVYKVDGVIVSKAEYDKYSKGYKNLANCKPCYMEHYNKKGVLIKYAAQYTDCRIGIYKEFFKDGKPKIIGHYKENHTGNWDSLYYRGYCSKKHGKWEYFNIYGGIHKTEMYENGRLVSTDP